MTYFEPALHTVVIARIWEALRPGGALIDGSQETLPGALTEAALARYALHRSQACVGHAKPTADALTYA